MTSIGEHELISRVRAALNPEQAPPIRRARVFARQAPDPGVAARIGGRSPEEKKGLLDELAMACQPLRIALALVEDPQAAGQALAALVADRSPEWGPTKSVCAWRHPLVEAMELEAALRCQEVPVTFTDPAMPAAQVNATASLALMGVTSADCCIAASATLVLRSRPGQPQRLALLPSIHAVIITADQMIADLAEWVARLSLENPEGPPDLTHRMTLITGPSKTADIEATLVHGAHGPRELHLFVIT